MARILVVEDKDTVLRVVRRMLPTLAHDVIEATDVASALEAFRASPPDLTLVDLTVPGDTVALMQLILSDEPTARIVALSGAAGTARTGPLSPSQGLEWFDDPGLQRLVTAVIEGGLTNRMDPDSGWQPKAVVVTFEHDGRTFACRLDHATPPRWHVRVDGVARNAFLARPDDTTADVRAIVAAWHDMAYPGVVDPPDRPRPRAPRTPSHRDVRSRSGHRH